MSYEFLQGNIPPWLSKISIDLDSDHQRYIYWVVTSYWNYKINMELKVILFGKIIY